MADLAAEFEKKEIVEASHIANNTAPNASVAPSATSIAGAVTPRRSIYSEENELSRRPTLDVGKSPKGQPGPVPHQISGVPSGTRPYSGDQPGYGYEQNIQQGAPHPNFPAPPAQHPGAANSGILNQYPPVPARPYYQTISRQTRSSSNQPNHLG